MPEPKFDPLIHAENRLQICAMLAGAAELEFKVLRDALDVSDSVLSKHIKSLEQEKYVNAIKRADLGRKRTWLSLTSQGRQAYEQHLQALRNIVGTL